MKQFFKFLLLLLTFFVSSPAFAENFYIENYEVNLNVDKNKSVQITEDIYANFTKDSHGIIREIPCKNAAITNISVSHNFSVKKYAKRVDIKIGDSNKLISGPIHYTIKYNYNYQDNKNEFYHNIIGTDWSVPIKKVKFSIIMPSSINPKTAGLSIGKRGAVGFNGGAVFYITNNNTKITGETFRELKPGEGITFRTPVNQNYFYTHTNGIKYFIIFLMLILSVIIFFCWLKFGKDKIVIPVVSCEVPKELNALQAETLLKEKSSNDGIVALIVELAGKKYIKIEKDKKGEYVFTKLKNPLYNTIEYKLMTGMFGENKDIISEADLKKSKTFYKVCFNLTNEVSAIYRTKYFEEKSISDPLNYVVSWCLIVMLLCFFYACCGFQIEFLFPNIECSIIFLLGYLIGLVCPKVDAFWFLWFGGVIAFDMLAYQDYLIFPSLGFLSFFLVCFVISAICGANLPKRTTCGQQLYGSLLGLKKYIKVCEEHELKLMAEENPQHFYNILAYAFILGVSDIWINKLKRVLEIKFDFPAFTQKMASLSQPSYDNGGIKNTGGSHSHGGRGHSGGGGGGGGGHSW